MKTYFKSVIQYVQRVLCLGWKTPRAGIRFGNMCTVPVALQIVVVWFDIETDSTRICIPASGIVRLIFTPSVRTPCERPGWHLKQRPPDFYLAGLSPSVRVRSTDLLTRSHRSFERRQRRRNHLPFVTMMRQAKNLHVLRRTFDNLLPVRFRLALIFFTIERNVFEQL